MNNQSYEDYWKLTVEYTDIHGDKFLGTLQMIVDFVDDNINAPYLASKYNELQYIINDKYPKSDMGSVRKSINQFVKLGFINFQLKSYHSLTLDFLNAKTNRKRKILFSKIFYTNSSFSRSVTHDSPRKEINFLIKTLEEVGKLDKEDIAALMLVDIDNIQNGCLTSDELMLYKNKMNNINFQDRKYNQLGYLSNFLNKLDDVVFVKNELYFKEDAKNIFVTKLQKHQKKRDNYLHRLYKIELKEEVANIADRAECMVEKLDYPTLIASHIKPFIKADENEEYDPNNGLLLSKNIDSLFDLGYISFKDNGYIIMLENILSKDLCVKLKQYNLDIKYLNPQRIKYLDYHRRNILRKTQGYITVLN